MQDQRVGGRAEIARSVNTFTLSFIFLRINSPHRKDRFRSSDTSSPSSGRLKTPSIPLRGLFRTSSSSGICVIKVTYDSHAPSLDKNTIICAKVADTISTNERKAVASLPGIVSYEYHMSGASRAIILIFILPNTFTLNSRMVILTLDNCVVPGT